jgi:hypothetical protein
VAVRVFQAWILLLPPLGDGELILVLLEKPATIGNERNGDTWVGVLALRIIT